MNANTIRVVVVLLFSLFVLPQVPIHHAAAAGQRSVGMMTAPWAEWVPLTLRHTIVATCSELSRLGGGDGGEEESLKGGVGDGDGGEAAVDGLDGLLGASLEVMSKHVILDADKELVGTYGGHSRPSRTMSEAYDATGKIVDEHGNEAPHLWLCGHFTAKSFTSMVRRLDAEADMIRHGTAPRVPRERRRENYLFWATKSTTQPRGEEDEWAQYRDMPVSVRKWGDRGKAESTLRPGGHVDSMKGGAEDYRHLMKAVAGSKL